MRAVLSIEIQDGETLSDALTRVLGIDETKATKAVQLPKTADDKADDARAEEPKRPKRKGAKTTKKDEHKDPDETAPKLEEQSESAKATIDNDQFNALVKEARAKIDSGHRNEVDAILKPYGSASKVTTDAYDDVLAAIEAL